MTIKVLDKATARQLHSGQVIVDIEAIVKELIENSIDAKATLIELIFINQGLESIQVKDNGDGIEEKDRVCVAKRHYTSKITTFDDLQHIHSYGFRGEAIHSICTVSDQVILTTKTQNDAVAKQYDVDKEGSLSNEKSTNTISHSGTMITVYKPFYGLPVRRQLAQKNAHQMIKKIQELLTAYALAHPKIRFSSVQATNTVGYSTSKNNTWIKPVTSGIEGSLTVIYGSILSNMLERWIETESTLTVDLVIPKPNSDPSAIYKGGDRVFVYVNQRPINYVKSELKDLISTIRNRYRQCIGLSDTYNKKNPFIYLDIQMEPSEYDVNIEPNKTAILFHNKQLVYNLIENILDKVYPSKASQLFFGSTPFAPDQAPFVIQHEAINDKHNHLPINAPHEISPPPSSPPEDNNNDWSFSMDSDLLFEELEPEEEQENGKTMSHSEKGDSCITPPWQIDHSEPGDIGSHTDNHIIEQLHTAPSSSSTAPPPVYPSSITKPSNALHRTRHLSNTNVPDQAPTLTQTRLPFTAIDTPSVLYRPELSPVLSQARLSIHQPHDNNSIPPVVPQKRPATFNLLHSSASQRAKITQPLTHTLNQTLTIDYTPQPSTKRYNHVSIHDYLSSCSQNEHYHATKMVQVPLGELTLYTQTLFDEKEQQRIVIEMGVYQTKELFIHLKSKDAPVVCKKSLPRPVQIQLRVDDPLCGSLLSLKGKQVLIKDDMHGHTNITYVEITDDLCIKNGFRVRYRSLESGFVIQFTAVSDVIENYGPKDFRELLQLIKDNEKEARPTKVVQYVRSLVEQHENHSEEDLIKALKELTWHQRTDNDWELGYSKEGGQVLACKLIGYRHQQ